LPLPFYVAKALRFTKTHRADELQLEILRLLHADGALIFKHACRSGDCDLVHAVLCYANTDRSGTTLPESWRQELTPYIAAMKWSEFQRMGEDDHEAKRLAERLVAGLL
jgi:hypothetical protein